jgi:phage tail sheath protein FI
MREGLTPGIRVAEQAGADEAMARAPTAIAAFVGRTLRGPVHRPVQVTSFAEFQSVFGGLWQPSTLSYAIEQYFENGGRTAFVVRVANGGRPATLTLPTGGAPLVLEAQCPGTREFLRAAVDYDNLGPADPRAFNLVVQRVRSPGSEHVEDQEIFRRLSVDPESPRHVAHVLAESTLVRLRGDAPTERPWATQRGDARALAGYVGSNPDGDDGGPLTDYDVIGSATEHTGLFALREVESFNFLCIPPLTREQPAGPSALLVAARYCRDRRAMLVVDPPVEWRTAAEAVAGVRDHAFASENAVMYWPWVLAYDRLRGRFEPFAPCGAAAGMLARVDAANPVWSPGEVEDGPLRPGLRPAAPVDEAWRAKLANAGVNALSAVRVRRALGARTLAGPLATTPDWKWLGLRRLALFLVDSIERGTRWALFEPNGAALWRRLERQVAGFLDGLETDGAFPGRPPGQSWFVICDERLNPPGAPHGVRLLFGVAALREGEYHCWLVTHGAGGSRSQGVTLNRLQSAGGRPPLDPELDVQTMFADAFRR